MATKYKLKTNKAVKKRFKKTSTGKVKCSKANSRHILTDKTTKKKRSLRQKKNVKDSDMKRLKRLLINI